VIAGLVIAAGIAVLWLMGSARTGPWVIAGLGAIFVALLFGPVALLIAAGLIALAWWRKVRPHWARIAGLSLALAMGSAIGTAASSRNAVPGTGLAAAAPVQGVPGNVVVRSQIPLFADVPPGGYPHGVYSPGNCTWWAAYNHPVPAWAPDGDAGRWYGNAIRDGIPTSQTPSVGAVVVYRAGAAYSSHGHVGIVIAMGPKTFRVSEMNYLGLDQVDERTAAWPDPEIEGFLPR